MASISNAMGKDIEAMRMQREISDAQRQMMMNQINMVPGMNPMMSMSVFGNPFGMAFGAPYGYPQAIPMVDEDVSKEEKLVKRGRANKLGIAIDLYEVPGCRSLVEKKRDVILEKSLKEVDLWLASLRTVPDDGVFFSPDEIKAYRKRISEENKRQKEEETKRQEIEKKRRLKLGFFGRLLEDIGRPVGELIKKVADVFCH